MTAGKRELLPRTPDDVTADLVRVAVAGGVTTRDATAERVRALTDEGYRLVREDERAKARKSLAAAWSAWLDLVMTVKPPGAGGMSLLQDMLSLEPGLRGRLLAALEGEDGG